MERSAATWARTDSGSNPPSRPSWPGSPAAVAAAGSKWNQRSRKERQSGSVIATLPAADQLAVIPQGGAPPEIPDDDGVPQHAPGEPRPAQLAVAADDRVGELRIPHGGPPLEGDVGADRGPPDRDPVPHEHRIVDRDALPLAPAPRGALATQDL